MDIDDLHFRRRPYHWLDANNQAQLGRFLFTSALAERAPRLTTAAVHPGAVITGAQARLPRMARLTVRTVMRPGFVRAEVGAIPVLRLAAAPGFKWPSGRFFNRCRITADQPDRRLAEAFWRACEEMTGAKAPGAVVDAELRTSA
jgi:hypothetical protein